MKCLTCEDIAENTQVYCAGCQVLKDDLLFGAQVRFNRLCGQCQRVCSFKRINAMVICCTYCNVSHEVMAR